MPQPEKPAGSDRWIWSFVYVKQKNVETATAAPETAGDVWTWTAIDADSKLVMSWMVGDRTGETARVFMNDLSRRLASRVQLTSDGHRPYLRAIEEAFGDDIDYAMLVKTYGESPEPVGRSVRSGSVHRGREGTENGLS